MPKTIAYLRVSTNEQDLEKNRNDILRLANEKQLGNVEFVEEKISGKTPWRDRAIAKIIDKLGEGDAIIVSEMSRLGRSMLECMEILSIASQKKIKIFAVKGNWHLDNTMQSKIMACVFSMAAEIERDLISSRTREALNRRRRNGLPLGRPKGTGKSKLDQYRIEIESLLNNGATKKFIANRYNTTPANLFNWLKKHNIN